MSQASIRRNARIFNTAVALYGQMQTLVPIWRKHYQIREYKPQQYERTYNQYEQTRKRYLGVRKRMCELRGVPWYVAEVHIQNEHNIRQDTPAPAHWYYLSRRVSRSEMTLRAAYGVETPGLPLESRSSRQRKHKVA